MGSQLAPGGCSGIAIHRADGPGILRVCGDPGPKWWKEGATSHPNPYPPFLQPEVLRPRWGTPAWNPRMREGKGAVAAVTCLTWSQSPWGFLAVLPRPPRTEGPLRQGGRRPWECLQPHHAGPPRDQQPRLHPAPTAPRTLPPCPHPQTFHSRPLDTPVGFNNWEKKNGAAFQTSHFMSESVSWAATRINAVARCGG